MTISWHQLKEGITREQAYAELLEDLKSMGFSNPESWENGSIRKTGTVLLADVYVALSGGVRFILKSIFNDTAEEDALTVFSDSHYDNQRNPAAPARHIVRLTATGAAGPYTIIPKTHRFRESATGKNLTFSGVDAPNETLSQGGTVDLTVACDQPGLDGNVAVGTITEHLTPLAGVTVTNPDLGAGSSLLVVGAEREEDPTLRQRNRTKWATLSWDAPAEALESYALGATSNITRVKVDPTNPRGPYTTDVYIAGAAGVASGPDTLEGTDAYRALVAIKGKVGVTDDIRVFPSAAEAQTFSANLYVASAYFDNGVIQPAKKAEIEDALRAYVNGLKIGGKVLPPPDGDGVQGYVLYSEWTGAVTAVEGVDNIGSPSPAANVTLQPFVIGTAVQINFTYIPIA